MRLIDADLLEPDADYDDGEFWAYSKRQIDEAPTVQPNAVLSNMQPAQPEQKKGKWVPLICTSDGKHHEWCGYQCSICGERTLRLTQHNFCPNCGKDMREEGERNEAD